MTAPDLPVDVRAASVSLAGRAVVRDVDLRVEPGELVALLGANGSGKSTLVRACVGLLRPSAGRVLLFGVPATRLRDRRRLGYVPQSSTATSGVPSTVGEVVTSGLLTRRPYVGWAGPSARRRVGETLDLVGLGDRARERVAELSGGQQQRVMIARALVGRPELLVMDEPTAGVDHAQQEVLAEVLASLVAGGTAVLLVAHELGPLESHVDRAVVLDDGRVVHDGPPAGAPAVVHGHDAHHRPRTGDRGYVTGGPL